MRKNFKRTLAVLCAAALTTLSVAVAGNLSSLKTAAEVSPSGEINFGGDNAYLKLNNAIGSAPTSVEAEVKMPSTIKDEWVLRTGGDLTNIIGGMKVEDGRVTAGTTVEGEAPGEGMGYIEFTSRGDTLTASTTNLGIDVSRYDASDLTLAFWAYSETDGKLFEGGQLRLADNNSGNDSKPYAYYLANKITVKAGWNYIELPLSEFTMANGYSFTNGITDFRIHGCKVTDSVNYRMERIGEVKLVVNKDASEWTLRNGGIGTTAYDGGIKAADITEYVSDENDAPGKGLKFEEFTSTADLTFTNSGNTVNVDVSAYAPNELAVDFWCWSENAGSLFKRGGLILSNRTTNVTVTAFIQYGGAGINVQQGWNHITLPLDKFTSVGNETESFDWNSPIKTFRFNGLAQKKDTDETNKIRIGEVKLVAKTENKVYTSTVDDTVYNNGYSILSNLNNRDNDTPYALFVTREGKPAFIYNDKMFVLNHNICTGEFVKLGVTVNTDGTVTFKVGDVLTATSTGTIDTNVAVAFTKGHSIGADANGGTLMNGSIKNLVVKNDETETGRWELSANKAYPLNAVKASVGSNDAHFAGIADSNAAVVVEYSNATAGAAPADAADMDGYVFAGWFTDKECTKALKGTGSAYAKYVDKAVLTVKAQIKNDAATAESTSMRFVTTVDSLNYKSVGFVINNVDKTLKTVYSNLYVVGDSSVMTKTPADVSNTSVSAYFAAFTVNNIPKDKYSAEFNVTPYWITLDGTRVSADTVVKTVSQGI